MSVLATERRRLAVRGIVQGVGFRPFVHRLATDLALDGEVRNDAQGVTIELEGRREALDDFLARLQREAPRLARIDSVESQPLPPAGRATGFAIAASGGGTVATAIGPDSAICDDCLRELFDPADRRWRYAFVNCTNCGPRYTITRALPYDRAMTSMAAFRAVPGVPRGVRAPGGSALPRRAERLPGLRAAAGLVHPRPHSHRRRRHRGDAAAAARRPHRRDQGAGRLPPRLRRAQRGRGRGAAHAQVARGEAVRADGRQSRVAGGHRRGRRDRGRAAGLPRAPDRAAAQAPRRGRGVRRRGPRPRVAGRDAALHAAAVPAVPRGRRAARRHATGSRSPSRSCW